MRIDDLPVVSGVVEAGPDDPVFDSLLLVGPFVVVLIAALGPTVLTRAIAGAYVALFVAYVLYRGVSDG